MPRCVGPPDSTCPYKAKGQDVHFRYAELELCPCCEIVMKQLNKIDISDTLVAEANRLKNKNQTSNEAVNSALDSTCLDKNSVSICSNNISNEIVCNELLCFLQNKMDILPQPMLIKATTDFYSDIEVKNAKDVLFDKCGNTVNPPMRNCSRTGTGKTERHISDIYSLLGRIPCDKLPVFAAVNLARLPPFDLECFDLSTLSQQVKEIRKGIASETMLSDVMTEIPILKEQIKELLTLKQDLDSVKTQVLQLTASNEAMKPAGCLQTLDGHSYPDTSKPNPQTVKQRYTYSQAAKASVPDSHSADTVLPKGNLTMIKSSTVPTDHDITKSISSDMADGFTVVQNKKKRRPPVIGKKPDHALKVLKGKRSSIFISRLSPDSTVRDIESFVHKSFNVSQLSCEKLKTRHDAYASFRLDITLTDCDDIFAPVNWPEGILIRKYFHPKQNKNG